MGAFYVLAEKFVERFVPLFERLVVAVEKIADKK